MRLAIVPVLAAALVAGGCDRQSPTAEQGNAVADAANTISADEVQPSAAPSTPARTVDRDRAGQAAPTFSFTDAAGRATSLADFRGRPVLVNLWATWCAPCVKELPTLDALATREKGKLAVLAISQDMDEGKVAPFWATRNFATLVPHTDAKMAWVPAVTATLPTTILYDAAGKEVLRVVGDYDWAGEAAARLIAEAR